MPPSSSPAVDNDRSFENDLQVLCTDSHFVHLQDYIEALLQFTGKPEASGADIAKGFAEKYSLPIEEVLRSLHVLNYLGMQITEGVLSPNSIQKDSTQWKADFGWDDSLFTKFATIVNCIQAHLPKLGPAYRRENAIAGVLPMFRDLSATVDARVIWEHGNGSFNFVPLASLALVLDSGDPDRVCFQITRSGLRELAAHLALIEKQLDIVEKALPNRLDKKS